MSAHPSKPPPEAPESPAAAKGSVGTRGATVKGSRPASPKKAPRKATRPTKAQKAWLARGAEQPGGKLPLFDHNGRRISARIIKACLDNGWAEPWFDNPLKPDWQVCKLTEAGRLCLENGTGPG